MTGFVYAIQSGALVKIGWSKDPIRRMAKIASDCPDGAALLGAIPGTRDDEAELHRDLSILRFRGEWFRFERRLKELVLQWPPFVPAKRRRPSSAHPLARYIAENDVTEAAIAKLAGCSQSAVNKVRNGVGNPTFDLLRRISDATAGAFEPADFEQRTDSLPIPTPAPNVAPKQCGVAE